MNLDRRSADIASGKTESEGHADASLPMDVFVRRTITGLISVIFLLSLAIVWYTPISTEFVKTTACRFLPSGEVTIYHSILTNCNLKSGDRIVAMESPSGSIASFISMNDLETIFFETDSPVRVQIKRGDGLFWSNLETRRLSRSELVHLAAGATVTPFILWFVALVMIWKSGKASAIPLALYYSSVAILTIWLLCSSFASWLLFPMVVLSAAGALASLWHLSFALLEDVEIASPNRLIPYAGYMVAFPLAMPLMFDPLSFSELLLFESKWFEWLFLLVGIQLAISLRRVFLESEYVAQRLAARSLLFVLLLCLVMATFFLTSSTVRSYFPHYFMAVTPMLLCTQCVGFCIARFGFLNFSSTIRRYFAYAFYISTIGLIVSATTDIWQKLGIHLPPASFIFAIVFTFVLVIEPARSKVKKFVNDWISYHPPMYLGSANEANLTIAGSESLRIASELSDPLDEIALLATGLTQVLGDERRVESDAKKLATRAAGLRRQMREMIDRAKAANLRGGEGKGHTGAQ